MKYLSVQELEALSDTELDAYANEMTAYQIKILAVMDVWIDYYNIASDEYDRRKIKDKYIINSTNTTKH